MVERVARFADAETMPWLGGGGITHELARHPADGAFDWRLSVAEVGQDGPFSSLPGVDRVIVLCSQGRMTLNGHPLQRFSPYAFDGATEISCAVPDGPTRDFNVMTRRGVCSATVATVVGIAEYVETASVATTFVVVMDGMVRAGGADLCAFDLLALDSGGHEQVDAGAGAAAIVTIRSSAQRGQGGAQDTE